MLLARVAEFLLNPAEGLSGFSAKFPELRASLLQLPENLVKTAFGGELFKVEAETGSLESVDGFAQGRKVQLEFA